MKRKLKVGLVQINNSFSGQSYFPLSAGMLQAYAQSVLNDLEFLPIIYRRLNIDEAVEQLLSADVVGFSVYLWNFNISRAIAEKLKKQKPKILIIFGGHHVPCRRTEDFLRKNRFIDIACHGDGEIVFSEILRNFKTGCENIPSVSYLDKNGRYIETEKIPRAKILDDLPSPYLTGVFDRLIAENPVMRWVGMWETNRGCPFSCSWCDWHGSKLGQWNISHVFREIDWFGKNKIEFVNCVDANFGILPRDIEIAEYLADTKKRTGYPQAVSTQATKNVQERSLRIQKILADAGLNRAVVMSIQSLNPPTLKAVGRNNVSLKTYKETQKKYNELGISTVTDLILAQPEETYESWVQGIDTLLNLGQHNKIQFGNLAKLPNSLLADPKYMKKYELKTVESAMVNNHGLLPDTGEIKEIQELVVSTSTMSPKDWVRARVFSWMTGLLHFDKLLQVPIIALHQTTGLGYGRMLEYFSEGKFNLLGYGCFPILTGIRDFFIKQARSVQKGGYEFCHAPEYLNIFWPADEYTFIRLCTGNLLSQFFSEAKHALRLMIKSENITTETEVVIDSFLLNELLIKQPYVYKDIEIQLHSNIWEIYRSAFAEGDIPIQKKPVVYKIDRTSEKWYSWTEWFEKVVWWGHRKGAYIYTNISVLPE